MIGFVFIFNTIWLTSQWSLAESSHTDLHSIPQEFVCITDRGDSFPALFAPDLNYLGQTAVFHNKLYMGTDMGFYFNRRNLIVMLDLDQLWIKAAETSWGMLLIVFV